MRNWQHKIDNTAPQSQGVLTAGEDNARGFELDNAVTQAGIALDPFGLPPDADSDEAMLAQAMCRAASGGVFGIDVGVAGGVVLNSSQSWVVPKALFQGMQVIFYAGAANPGPSLLNAFGLGNKQFFDQTGAPMQGGELAANILSGAIYDPALSNGIGAWRLLPWANARTQPSIDLDLTPPAAPWTYRINNQAAIAVDVDAAVGDFALNANPSFDPLASDYAVGFYHGGAICKIPLSAWPVSSTPSLLCLSGGVAGFDGGAPTWTWTQRLSIGVWETKMSLATFTGGAVCYVVVQWSFDGHTWYTGLLPGNGGGDGSSAIGLLAAFDHLGTNANSSTASGKARFNLSKFNSLSQLGTNYDLYALLAGEAGDAIGGGDNPSQTGSASSPGLGNGFYLASQIPGGVPNMPQVRLKAIGATGLGSWGSPVPTCCLIA